MGTDAPKVTVEELDELQKAYQDARTTPVMLVGGVDVSGTAWGLVRTMMDRLSDKYHVPRGTNINSVTREFMT